MDKAPAPFTRDTFARTFGAGEDVLKRLDIYERLLGRWQKGTNLVAASTLGQVWHRHFADSAQLLRFAGDWTSWVDLGSGAGFPGLVVAICVPNQEDKKVHLVESNMRKCAFIREVVRETGCSVEIHDSRIESLPAGDKVPSADIVSARALAPLDRLLALSSPLFAPGTTGLFLKGRQAEQELAEARTQWTFDARLHPSVTGPDGHIVEVGSLAHRDQAIEENGDE